MLVLTMTTPSLPCEIQHPSACHSHLNNFPDCLPQSAEQFHPPPFHLILPRLYPPGKITHLLAVNTPVVRLDDDEALAGDVQAVALDLLDVAGVLVGGDNLLHLSGRDGEAGAGRPDAVALVVEDGGLVDVAGADEAVGQGALVRDGWWRSLE